MFSGKIEHQAAEDAAELLGMDSLSHIVCFDMAQLLGVASWGICGVQKRAS